MKKSLALLAKGFESSCGKTPEFKAFARTFKKELNDELGLIGAYISDFNVGHFYVFGFLKKSCLQADGFEKLFYFSLSDVRRMETQNRIELLYRTAKHNKDFTGGHNNYVTIEQGMGQNMEKKLLNL